MNNALFLEPESEPEVKRDTSEEEARLTRMIEAISGLLANKDWLTLQELHFSKEKERIQRLLVTESKKRPLQIEEIYKLQGEDVWATRYADFHRWVINLRNQLSTLKHE